MIDKMIVNMAIKSMKDNFLALNDEQKQSEFCKLLDENQALKERQKRFMNYLNDSIRELEEEKTDTIGNALNSSIIVIIKAVLRNYKEIIGEENEL